MKGRGSILIVDDDRLNVKLLKGKLLLARYHILTANNGEEAIRTVHDEVPDLILLDVMMPGIDGFEVCEYLKTDEKTKRIPIIMITALQETEHRIKAMESGADDFLTKPVDHMELMIRVKSLLRIKTYQDELLRSYDEISQKKSQLEEIEKVKEGLTHMIIHDLRNPLMAISGNIEMVLFENNHFAEGHLDRLKKSLEYCQDLESQIQSLLDIHRIEQAKLELDIERIDLPELIEDVIAQFMPKAESKMISLSLKTHSSVPPVVLDSNLIKRVMANLLSNAVKHTPKGGEIECSLVCHMKEHRMQVSVRDSGIGLALDFHEKIFNKFEQIELKRCGVRTGGSGLGLAFCKMVIEEHGGKIWVESGGLKKGCTFSLTLPIREDLLPSHLKQSKNTLMMNHDNSGRPVMLLGRDISAR
jgi:signal transduction histidine kinase